MALLPPGRETATSYWTTLSDTVLWVATDSTDPFTVVPEAGKDTEAAWPAVTLTMSASATAAVTCWTEASTRVTRPEPEDPLLVAPPPAVEPPAVAPEPLAP